MKIDNILDMSIRDVLNKYCVVYSPECGYYYGITEWEDAEQIYGEFDLEEEYCFCDDSLIPFDYGFDCGEDILSIDDLRIVMAKLGITKKQSCPLCGTNDYHYDYNTECMVCNECGYQGEAEYEKLPEECE